MEPVLPPAATPISIPEPLLVPGPAYPTLRESWAILGWYLLVMLVVGGSCYGLLRYTTRLPRIELVMIATISILVALLLFLRWKAGSRWQPGSLVGQARAWHYAALPVVAVATQQVFSLLNFLPLPNILAETFAELNQHIGTALLGGALAVPVLEELLFRGVVLAGLLRSRRPWVAIAQSALLFGIFHFNPSQSLNAALAGLLLGWLYYRTRSLGLCIALHALFNGIEFAALYWGPAAWRHTSTIAELYPSAAHYAGAVALSAAVLWAYVRGVARSTTPVAGVG